VSEAKTPWTEKFRPTNLDQVVGNSRAVSSLRKWFDSWSPDAKNKAVILNGVAGIGKTSSVIALATERGYEIVEMNASDRRNKKSVLEIAVPSTSEGSLVSGSRAKRILLIDEVDGLHRYRDRGGVSSLVKIIKEAQVPIICTANDAYAKKLKRLRKLCKVISYKPILTESIVKVLKRIRKIQNLSLSEDDLQFIAEQANGDLRSAINDLQGMALQLQSGKDIDVEMLYPYRDQTKDIQQALTDLFRSHSFVEGKKAINGLDMKYDTLLLWVYDNAFLHCSKEQLPEVYETIAHADRFLGRIYRRQEWKLLSYFFDLVSGGVSAMIDKPNKNIKRYIFPQKIRLYGQTKWTRSLNDSIVQQIAEKTHTSQNYAQQFSLPVVKEILNDAVGNAAEMANWLELDSRQIKALVKDKAKVKKMKKVIQAMEKHEKDQQTKMGNIQHSSFDRPQEDWEKALENWEQKKEALKEKEEQEEELEEAKTNRSENQVSLDKFF
jgi:replication factor C large subunit